MKQTDRLRDWVFQQVHTKNLVYNTCWEDPRCDRELLDISSDSKIAMITSAGCNALDYLLDDPAEIHCIDMNPRQNALLHLKQAAFRQLTFDDLFALFGQGAHPEIPRIYREHLRPALTDVAQEYWDTRLHYFNGRGPRKSFYHYGSSGTFAWMANRYLKASKKRKAQIDQLFGATTLEEQAQHYSQIERKVMNNVVEWVVNRHFIMCMVGVPRSQQRLFATKYERGALGFIQECLHKVFTERPIRDNYFWRLYLYGAYTPDCCPAYLERNNFPVLRERVDRIQTHTTTIADFLRENPGPYSHYILLDHQDWLAANNISALEEEWQLILQNSRPGTRILIRSAAEQVDFFPDFVKEAVWFEQQKTQSTHQWDRVGTYASVYLAIVK